MGASILPRKFHRNVEDHGLRVALVKAMRRILSPVAQSTTYRLYRVELNHHKLPETSLPDGFAFFEVTAADEETIAAIERYAEWMRGTLKKRLEDGALCVAVLRENELAAFNLIVFDEMRMPLVKQSRRLRPGEAWSSHIAVFKGFRRRGVALALRHRVFATLAKRGIRRLYGGTLRDNEPALKLTRRADFREIADLTFRKVLLWKSWRYRRLPAPPSGSSGRTC